MKIGIDLDGVVFDTEALWMTLAEIYDCKGLRKNSIVAKEEPRVQEKYNWSNDELNDFLNKYVDVTEFNIVSGAKEVIKLLREEGHELIVITARGSLENSSDGVNIAKEKLDNEGIKFDKYYWKQKAKLEICQKENIDIMIDDNYHICESLNSKNIKVLYFNNLGRKNLAESDILKQVTNWGEVYRYIKYNF